MEDHSGMEPVYTIITWVCSTVVLATLGYFFYWNRWLFAIFGFITFICVLALILEFTIRRVTRYTYRDIGEQGTHVKPVIGKPFSIAPISLAHAPSEKPVKVTPVIPKLSEMLTQGLIDGVTLYLGYKITEERGNAQVEPYTGTFEDLRTFVIAGKGGSGKTMRLFFLLIQFILAHATIVLCDPHGSDSGSITGLLEPLLPWVKVAVTDFKGDIEGQVMRATVDFKDTMERRVHGLDKSRSPVVLVVDEVTRMVYHETYGPDFVDTCCKIADEYRKFGGFLIVSGQSWTAAGKGKKVTDLLARLKRAFHAKFIHRLDKEYAKFFFEDGKLLKRIDHILTKQCFFFDTEGQFHELYTPHGTISDAFTALKLLQELPGTVEYLQLGRPKEQIAYPYYAARPGDPGVTVTPYSPVQQLPERVFSSNGRGESVREPGMPVYPGESGFYSHRESVREPVKPGETVTPEDEQAIMRVYFLLDADRPGKVTRSDILEKLGWNNKKWPVLKAVCDKYGFARG